MIRGFLKGDEVSIAELEKRCFSTPWSEEALLSSYREGMYFFVFESEGKICGYVGLSVVLDEGYISNIAVDPDSRRRGIGRMLLLELDRLAEDLNLAFISLEVRGSNDAAIALYTSLGYKAEGLRKSFYENPREDAIIMTKRRESTC